MANDVIKEPNIEKYINDYKIHLTEILINPYSKGIHLYSFYYLVIIN